MRKMLKTTNNALASSKDPATLPICLNIKREIPVEIAISMAAQMILHRAERNGL